MIPFKYTNIGVSTSLKDLSIVDGDFGDIKPIGLELYNVGL